MSLPRTMSSDRGDALVTHLWNLMTMQVGEDIIQHAANELGWDRVEVAGVVCIPRSRFAKGQMYVVADGRNPGHRELVMGVAVVQGFRSVYADLREIPLEDWLVVVAQLQ